MLQSWVTSWLGTRDLPVIATVESSVTSGVLKNGAELGSDKSEQGTGREGTMQRPCWV